MYSQTKHKERKHFCIYCLQCFPYEKTLINHKENCITVNGAQAIKMPEDDDMVYFKNCHKGLEASFDSLFMLILRLSIKRYTDVNQIIKSYTESYQG